MTEQDTVSTTADSGSAGWRGWLFRLAPLLAIPIVFLILYSRSPNLLLVPQPTWEDGRTFIEDGIRYNGPEGWFKIYAGYVLVIPRLLCDGLSIYNLPQAPLYLAVVSLLNMAWVFCLFLSRAFDGLMPFRYRASVTLAMALMPWCTETFGTFANFHTYLYLGLCLLSLADFNLLSRAWRILLPPFLLLAVFTTPNSVLTFPVYAVRLWHERRARRSYAFRFQAFALALLLAYAVYILAVSPEVGGQRAGLPDLAHFMVKGVGFKVVIMSLFGGLRGIHEMSNLSAYAVAASLWAVVVAAAFHAARRTGGWPRAAVVAALAYYTVASVAFAGLFRPHYVDYLVVQGNYYGADRYFVPPVMFLYITIASVLWLAMRALPRGWRLAILAGLVALGPYGWRTVDANYHYPTPPDWHWRERVTDYYRALLKQAPALPPRPDFEIPCPPDTNWSVRVPMVDLDDADRRRIERLLQEHGRYRPPPPAR